MASAAPPEYPELDPKLHPHLFIPFSVIVTSACETTTQLSEAGFCNFRIRGGNLEVSGGTHVAGIGAACNTQAHNASAYTKNIYISGGNIKATGTDSGPGIGG